jgi:hypothetical protein
VPVAFADCDSGNDHDPGSPATTVWRQVVSPTPVTALEVTAVQPAGADAVVGAPGAPPPPPPEPVVMSTSSRYQGFRSELSNATWTIAAPAGGVYVTDHGANAPGDTAMGLRFSEPSEAQPDVKYCTLGRTVPFPFRYAVMVVGTLVAVGKNCTLLLVLVPRAIFNDFVPVRAVSADAETDTPDRHGDHPLDDVSKLLV